jgi:outer membrane protein assembly factor BamB
MLLILSTGLCPVAQETANRNTTQATVSGVPSPAASGSATNTPLWQTRLNVEETDFIQFVSKDRVLVGTVHVHPIMGGAVSPHEIMLLNSGTGETVWAVSREHYAFPQSILAVSPLIILQGGNQIVALNPASGAQVWNLESARSESLFLPSQDLIVSINRSINHKPAPMSLVAVDLKTGNEVWKTPVDNYPQGKEAKTELATMSGSVLLSGPEVAAFSAANGKLLWRMPFPGKYGAKATAIPLGDDLYFSDDAAIGRADPASGKQMWSVPIADGSFQALTSDGRNAFTLLKGSAEGAPNSIAALDRDTGKQLWKSDLLDRAASPISIEGDRLYVTTPANVIAMRASDGSVAFRAEIPTCLQSRRQLPDHLGIATDRIIVAREDGVLAVQKGDGKLLFADAVPGGKGFTYDYATNRFLHASLNAAPRKKNHPIELNAESASPDEAYRVAAGQQRFAYNQSAAMIQRQIAMTNIMTTGYAQPTYQQQQAAAGGAALAGSITNAAMGVAGALNAVYLEALRQSYQIRAQQTFQTHAVSLQDKLHIRPSYRQPQGWSLHVVNLETGEHADILLSSDADLKPNVLAANLPAFSADGLRIVSRGLGPNAEQVKKRVGLGHAMVTYPSVLAFDLSSLHFEPASMAPASVAKPAEAAKNTPDHRLLEAAYQGDLDAAKKALDSGANVNAADEYGNTALMLAAEASPGSNDRVVKLLLEKGADADARDPSGLTAWEHTHLLAVVVTKGMLGSFKAIKKAQRTEANTRSWAH